jgi:excinuclease UvrABC nuclease subunit
MIEISWSDWLDFSAGQIANVPESPGVFMMHAAMKILYIGGSDNLRASIDKSLTSPCVSESKRFRYSVVAEYDEIKERLLAEYKEKHDGKMPRCME